MKRHPAQPVVSLLLLALLTAFMIASSSSCGGSSGISGSWPVLLGTTGDDFGSGVAVDRAGNIVFTGETSGSLGGAPFSGPTDLFLAKYLPSGNRQWIRQRGPARGTAVAVDGTGNIYVAGFTESAFDNNTFFGSRDVILVKYDSSGIWLWSVQFGTPASDEPNALISGNGFLYIAGSTSGDLGGAGNAGSQDAWLAKIDPANGNRVWVKQIGTASFEVGEGVAMDNAGHIFLCGETDNGDVEETGTPPGGEDIFVASFLDNGTLLWKRQYGTASNEYPVAIGAFDNVLYVTGYADGDIDGSPNQGSWDTFLWRINGADGNSSGATLLGSTENDFAENLAIAPDGSIYVTGRTNGNLGGSNKDPTKSTYDIFLSKFNSSGILIWTRQAGTSEEEFANDVATDSEGFAYVSGKTRGNLGGITNTGLSDAFLLKYNENGVEQ